MGHEQVRPPGKVSTMVKSVPCHQRKQTGEVADDVAEDLNLDRGSLVFRASFQPNPPPHKN